MKKRFLFTVLCALFLGCASDCVAQQKTMSVKQKTSKKGKHKKELAKVIALQVDNNQAEEAPITYVPSFIDKDIEDLPEHLIEFLDSIENEKYKSSIWCDFNFDYEACFANGEKNEVKNYIESHLKYPALALEKGIEGNVTLRFVIDEKGKIKDIKVKKSDNYFLNEEAIRVIKSMPDWKPAQMGGNPVKNTIIITIVFKLKK